MILEAEAPQTTDIAVVVAHNPAIVLVDEAKRDDLFAHIRREIEAFTPDLSTTKGRDAIKTLAFKITRTKTAIDGAGKQLNEEARAKINVVDAARRDAREKLDAMAAEVRRPLTEWEDAEKARVERGNALIAQLKDAATVTLEDTAATVRERGGAVWNTEISADDIGDDLFAEASAVKQATVVALKTALARLEKEEADRAELEKLRAEAAERERIEAERRAEEEQAAREAEEARIAEERRVAAEKAEADRIARAQQEATAEAQRVADEKAQAERDRIQREHDEQLAAERRRAEEAERAAQAERDRIAAAEAARAAEAKRLADEQAAREANKAHRTRVKTAAKQAIMTCGVSEEAAQKIVLAIIAGEVPAVKLEF